MIRLDDGVLTSNLYLIAGVDNTNKASRKAAITKLRVLYNNGMLKIHALSVSPTLKNTSYTIQMDEESVGKGEVKTIEKKNDEYYFEAFLNMSNADA